MPTVGGECLKLYMYVKNESSQFKQLTSGVRGVRWWNKGQNVSRMDLIQNAIQFPSVWNDSLLETMVGRRTHYKHFLVHLWSCLALIFSLSLSAVCQSCYTVFHHLALFLPYEPYIIPVSMENHRCLRIFSWFSQEQFGLNWLSESEDTGPMSSERDAVQRRIMRKPNLSLNVCCRRDLRKPLTTRNCFSMMVDLLCTSVVLHWANTIFFPLFLSLICAHI